MSGALVNGQLVLVEGETGSVPMLVVNIACDICGSYSIILAAHHVRAVVKVLTELTSELPDAVLADEGEPVPLKRPTRPEDN